MPQNNSKAKELTEKVEDARERTVEAVKATANAAVFWSSAAEAAAKVGKIHEAAILSSFANQATKATSDLAKMASDDQAFNTCTKILDAAIGDEQSQ